MTDEQHVFDDIPEFDVVGDLQRQLSEARAEVAQLRADWARDCAVGLAEVTALREALETIYTTMRGDEKSECWTIRKWLDDRDIFNDDIEGPNRLVEELCKALLRPPEPIPPATKGDFK